jgi:predicted outer membrane repeat protein
VLAETNIRILKSLSFSDNGSSGGGGAVWAKDYEDY